MVGILYAPQFHGSVALLWSCSLIQCTEDENRGHPRSLSRSEARAHCKVKKRQTLVTWCASGCLLSLQNCLLLPWICRTYFPKAHTVRHYESISIYYPLVRCHELFLCAYLIHSFLQIWVHKSDRHGFWFCYELFSHVYVALRQYWRFSCRSCIAMPSCFYGPKLHDYQD